MIVKNVPNYAYDYQYLVATLFDDNLYFYGSFNDYSKAKGIVENSEDKIIVNIEEVYR